MGDDRGEEVVDGQYEVYERSVESACYAAVPCSVSTGCGSLQKLYHVCRTWRD